jgi:hypothetical protein
VELRTLKPTAEVEFETKDGTFKFEVEHIPADQASLDYQSAGRLSDMVRAALCDAIVGWNLIHDDGTPWECDEKNRAALLPQLVVMKVKAKDKVPEGTLLSLALLEFIRNPENFLKN